MKLMLYHLRGSRRGRMQCLDAEHLSIGTGEQCGLVFDARHDPQVHPLHAEVCFENHLPVIHDRSGHHALFVNGRRCLDTPLNSGDVVELGEGGPQLRIRFPAEGSGGTKSWHEIVQDSREILVRTPHARYMSPLVLARHLLVDILRYGSPMIRMGAAMALLAPLVIIAMLAIALYHQYVEKQATERQVNELIVRLETGRLTRSELESRIDQERRAAAELKGERDAVLDKLNAEVKARAAAPTPLQELEKLHRELRDLESAQIFAQDIVDRFEGSIGLLQGGYGFKEKGTGRPLRYRGFDPHGNPITDADGHPLVTVEGSETPVLIYYAGTAFLIDARGFVVTNRHMVRMWEGFPPAREAIEAGFEPDLKVFRLFFPGMPEPYTLRVVQVSQEVDLALLQTDRPPTGIKPLVLLPAKAVLKTGEPVAVLSYPGSFDSILGRLSTAVSDAVVQEAGSEPVKLAEALARRDLVRPLATQGHIANVATEVITFEAGSASGSSGSPIFDRAGRVIGVNRGSLRKTGGLNVAIPIQFVRPLLVQAGK